MKDRIKNRLIIVTVSMVITLLLKGLVCSTPYVFAHEQDSSLIIDNTLVIQTLGATTLFFLVITLLLGRRLLRDRKKFFPWHKRAAYVTVILGVIHLLSVIILH